ncbi:hypothetical protein [Pseudomonas mandelii]|uniref:Uncharacterized protein n=1 Tax=Pseudomonas mandelii TaxID=75612 RepID=A0A502IDU8_9PSED|nr:hypothetical protein [Pseudomonas mandelii]TPG85119.1 hypothetical protein EAH74_07440 [Pseudomonas mandelii]
MNITINVSITVQQPEVQTIIRLPATTVETKAPREQTGFEYMQHRQRMYDKIKRLFGNDAALHYLANAL